MSDIKDTVFQVRMSAYDHGRFKKVAQERGKAAASLARDVLSRWLDQQQIEAEKRQERIA